MKISRLGISVAAAGLAVLALAPSADAAGGPYQYFALTPCRLVDTRNAVGTNGGPALVALAARDFKVQGNCGVPTGATAATINVTITGGTENGYLSLWPSGTTKPLVSTINFTPSDPALANGAIVPLSTNTNDLSVYFGAGGAGSVHLVMDVTGYFAP